MLLGPFWLVDCAGFGWELGFPLHAGQVSDVGLGNKHFAFSFKSLRIDSSYEHAFRALWAATSRLMLPTSRRMLRPYWQSPWSTGSWGSSQVSIANSIEHATRRLHVCFLGATRL